MRFGPVVLLGALFLAASGARAADVAAVDRSIDPCDNFYQFACKPWIAANPLPADQSRWTRFDALSIRVRDQLHGLLEDAVAHPAPDSAKVADYYASCMDEAGIEKADSIPLKDEFDRIAALQDKNGLPALAAGLQEIGVEALFDFSSGPDDHDPDRDIAILSAGGLGLPDRDYYVKDDAKSVELRNKYRAHVAKMLTLLGDAPPTADNEAQAILDFETELAKHSLTRVQRRDPKAVYHPLTRTALAEAAPGFAWTDYFAKAGTPPFDMLNVAEPAFATEVAALVTATPLDTIKTYLRWQLVHRSAPFLPAAFVNEDFAFFGRTLQGKEQIEPRWRRCVVATDAALGEALGKLYVARYFPDSSREQVKHLIGDVRAAYSKDISALPWMGAETRKRALQKLDAIVEKIGHPDKWRDYSSLEIVRGAPLANDFRAAAFETRRELAKIGKPADRLEWHMTPPTVNAYYSPKENNINFPAGILQLPFFDPTRDEAANLGGLGAVAGHEMTHGFDDHGRQFAANGALSDWWTEDDANKFKDRAHCIVDQYSAITAIDEVHVNGELTLGENTADNGGLRLALMALAARGLDKQVVDGFDGRQRFFIAFAQLWCGSIRPEGARLRAQTDPHSPAFARVNATVSNMPEFAEAFHCKAGAKMIHTPACRVW
ncbi:MAG TPA: M13 family metallopeptidase [Stellaceae bacterium]|nr:M13 family metallopeptidase [Stellaceae bacterium]